MHVNPGRRRLTTIVVSRVASTLVLLAVLLCLPPMRTAADGRVNWEHEFGDSVLSIAASADDSVIAVGERDNHLYVFDMEGNLLWQYLGSNSIVSVDVSDDGSLILAASNDAYLRLFARDGELLWEFKGPRAFSDCAITDDNAYVLGVSSLGSTITMLTRDGAEIWTRNLVMPVNCVDVYGSGDSVRPVIGLNDSQVRVLNKDGDQLLAMRLDAHVLGVAVSANGARIAAALDNGKLVYANGANGQILWSYDARRPGTRDRMYGVSMSADGQVVMAGASNGNVFVFDGEGTLLQTTKASEVPVQATFVSRDGSLLMYGGQDNVLRVIDRAHFGSRIAGEQQQRRNILIGATVGMAVLVGALTFLFSRTEWGRRTWHVALAPTRRILASAWRARICYLMLLPTVVLLLILNYFPAFSGLFHGFTRWTPGLRAEWIGLQNYRDAFRNPYLWVGVKNTLLFMGAGYIQLLSPLLVAELIFNVSSARAAYWWRTVFIFPMVVPGVVGILLWRNLYDPNYGMVNKFFELVNLSQLQRVWLGDPKVVLGALVFMGFPWVGALPLLLFYGNLISIPTDLFDAAKVDGASFLRRFWHIDLPMLLTTIKTLVILGFIGGIQAFGNVYLTTGGGPGHRTYTPALEMYYQATRFSRLGSAAAIGTLLFVVILTGTILNIKYIRGSATEFEA